MASVVSEPKISVSARLTSLLAAGATGALVGSTGAAVGFGTSVAAAGAAVGAAAAGAVVGVASGEAPPAGSQQGDRGCACQKFKKAAAGGLGFANHMFFLLLKSFLESLWNSHHSRLLSFYKY